MSESTPGESSGDYDITDYLPAEVLLPILTASNGSRIPVRDLLRIDPNNLVHEFQIHPNWQATIAWQTSLQEVKVARLDRDVERLEASLYIRERSRMTAEGKKTPGVELIKSYVTVDPALRDLQDRLFDEKEKLGAWKAAANAVYARRECLINMGAETRLDRKTGG